MRAEISVPARLAQTAAVFIVATIVVAACVLSRATPIAWEDHFQIGQNLRSTGALTIDGVPSIFRPPGYPGFVAASLWIGDADLPCDRTIFGPAQRGTAIDASSSLRKAFCWG